MLLYLCSHKSWMTYKMRRTCQCTCIVCSMKHTHRMPQGKVKARKNLDEENAHWNLTLFHRPPTPQKSKILYIKKMSFVLASISKKYKLKFDKNISLVQNSSTGISSEIPNSSYCALSGRTSVSHWGTVEKPGHGRKCLRSKSVLITIWGSQKCGLYTWVYTFFF